MQDQSVLTLRWRSFLGGGIGDIVISVFAHEGSQYRDYRLMPLHSAVITQDARPNIFNAPLTLISRTVQWGCRFPLYL